MFHILQQSAGATADNNRSLRSGQLFLDGLLGLSQIVRIHHAYAANANGAAQGLQIDLGAGVTLQVVTGGGVLLMTGHTGNGVIYDNNGSIGLVVSHVDQAGHTGMHEGGIADHGHGVAVSSTLQCLGKTMGTGNEAPIQITESMAFKGATAPRV